MLIRANYKGKQIVSTHAQRIDETSAYCNELRKDSSNGFTKGRSMRRLGSFPVLTLMEYDRLHPGWYARAQCGDDLQTKQKAWHEFLASDYAKPFMMVDKLLH